jgi:hypothetical protein
MSKKLTERLLVRLTEKQKRMVEELCVKYGLTQRKLVTMAIDSLFDELEVLSQENEKSNAENLELILSAPPQQRFLIRDITIENSIAIQQYI